MKHPSIRNHQSDLSETIRNCIKSHHASATLLPLVQVIAWKGICLTVDRVEITLSAWCWCWWLILFSFRYYLRILCIWMIDFVFQKRIKIEWYVCLRSPREHLVRIAFVPNDFSWCVQIELLNFFFSKMCAVDVCIRRICADCWSSYISQD